MGLRFLTQPVLRPYCKSVCGVAIVRQGLSHRPQQLVFSAQPIRPAGPIRMIC